LRRRRLAAKAIIEKPSDELNMDGAVECQERLGGILGYYRRRAA